MTVIDFVRFIAPRPKPSPGEDTMGTYLFCQELAKLMTRGVNGLYDIPSMKLGNNIAPDMCLIISLYANLAKAVDPHESVIHPLAKSCMVHLEIMMFG